ncbi:MAG: nucleoside-diphosphate kinase [Lentimicrobiaceae bacterium]|nr:nucleoside-diphosphate kinase [Lentimicrobiaceae bacterium]
MSGNKTFTIIKPLAVQKGFIGPILNKINEAGFRITAMKFIKLTQESASDFYAEHMGKPFYEPLINFMSSAPVVVAILEKENAVEEYRKLIGSTDPAKAAVGTIRNLYGTTLQQNAVHGSDSDTNAERECNYFFSCIERF